MRRIVIAAVCGAALLTGCGADEEQNYPPGIGRPLGPNQGGNGPDVGTPSRIVESTRAPSIELSECGEEPNALFLSGTGALFDGTQLVTEGSFTGSHSGPSESGGNRIGLTIVPTNEMQGRNWQVDFSTTRASTPLSQRVYLDAERHPFEPPGVPGLRIAANGRVCNTLISSFEIHALQFGEDQELEHLEATFEHYCEKQSANRLRGCVRFTRAQ